MAFPGMQVPATVSVESMGCKHQFTAGLIGRPKPEVRSNLSAANFTSAGIDFWWILKVMLGSAWRIWAGVLLASPEALPNNVAQVRLRAPKSTSVLRIAFLPY